MKNKKILIYFLFAFLYVSSVLLFLYFNKYGYRTYLKLGKKIENLEKTKTELVQKKEMLKKELELQNSSSPFFIEMIARERLRMAKKGEVIYIMATSKNNKGEK